MRMLHGQQHVFAFFNLKELQMWELHPNGTSSEKGPLSHRNNAGSFKNNRHSNKDANDNIFVSETIDTIANSLYHVIEKTSSSCLPPSRWRTRRNPRKTGILDFLKITEYNCIERKELICVTSQAGTRAHLTERNKFIFFSWVTTTLCVRYLQIFFLHHTSNKELKLNLLRQLFKVKKNWIFIRYL